MLMNSLIFLHLLPRLFCRVGVARSVVVPEPSRVAVRFRL